MPYVLAHAARSSRSALGVSLRKETCDRSLSASRFTVSLRLNCRSTFAPGCRSQIDRPVRRNSTKPSFTLSISTTVSKYRGSSRLAMWLSLIQFHLQSAGEDARRVRQRQFELSRFCSLLINGYCSEAPSTANLNFP